MKLEEMFRKPFSDPDEVEAHSRSTVQVTANISFAHERGYEEAFTQLQSMPAFKAALEEELMDTYRSLAQRFISQSQIRPGYGWMDDLECEVSVAVGSPKVID